MNIGEVYNSLSPIRREIYDFVRNQEEQSQELVTVRDVADGVGIVVSNAAYHITRLCEVGLLFKDDGGHIHVVGAFSIMPDMTLDITDAKTDKFRVPKWRKELEK